MANSIGEWGFADSTSGRGVPRQTAQEPGGVSEPSFPPGQRERAENGHSSSFGHSGNGQVPPRPAQPPTAGSGRGGRAAGAAGAAAGGFVGALGGSFVPPLTVNVNGKGNGNGGRGNGGGNGGGGAAGPDDRHQGDQMIHLIERIEFKSEKDIVALAKAINHLGRELHLILGMRAEEINGVLSTYKGKWYTFGASSKIKARLVSAHLKVSAEAAKALGVGALKMAHAFDRHFVKPEREAKQRRSGKQAPRRQFTIGDQ
ncbi:hypothetical protein [Streptomyces sp. ADI98-10]|uniref:hypothetical protein n=1 Tax=Streptomyces sp. ADI98-10 TaxID=1522763 RepID=UPI000F555F3A|nr:hypothetical protein [Streptomyces sp. ADI98-10]RPK77826.1 hypothetical protein EES46_34740 [Streptomyces sp. ADI98-10]